MWPQYWQFVDILQSLYSRFCAGSNLSAAQRGCCTWRGEIGQSSFRLRSDRRRQSQFPRNVSFSIEVQLQSIGSIVNTHRCIWSRRMRDCVRQYMRERTSGLYVKSAAIYVNLNVYTVFLIRTCFPTRTENVRLRAIWQRWGFSDVGCLFSFTPRALMLATLKMVLLRLSC